jgi:hypothetical protein
MIIVLLSAVYVIVYFYEASTDYFETLDAHQTILRDKKYAWPVAWGVVSVLAVGVLFLLSNNPDEWDLSENAQKYVPWLLVLAYLCDVGWISFFLTESSKWRALVAFFLILAAHVFLLAGLLFMKPTVSPILRAPFSLHFGWLFTIAAITFMAVLYEYDVSNNSRTAWATLLIVTLSTLSATLGVALACPGIPFGTAFGVFAYAAYLEHDRSEQVPVLYAIFWSAITAGIVLVLVSLLCGGLMLHKRRSSGESGSRA